MEPILQQWEEFAKTIWPSREVMTSAELRDHAQQMLIAIAADLDTPQTPKEQFAKSVGKGPDNKEETAAETHALARLLSGFTIGQMVSEYRALRTSVLTLWIRKNQTETALELEDMTRFNEAIDQALAESVARYSHAVTKSQHMFIGILGHDLRTPLGAISLGAEALLHADELDSRYTKIASRIFTSVGRANNIIESLLDFARSSLGGGIPIVREKADLAAVCRNIVEEVRAYHPERTIVFESPGELTGHCDPHRMEQVFSNIIQNAVQHGDHAEIVTVSLHGDQGEIIFAVHNRGEPIAERDLPYLFNPMSRHSRYASNEREPNSGLGLGLYIANEIVTAHGGKIEVHSTSEDGTTFLIRIPFNKA